jgi:hypothetical protein
MTLMMEAVRTSEMSTYFNDVTRRLSNGNKQFKSALNNYLHANSFYSIDEYLNVNRE